VICCIPRIPDISYRGLFLEADYPTGEGQEISMELTLSNWDRAIILHLLGTVLGVERKMNAWLVGVAITSAVSAGSSDLSRNIDIRHLIDGLPAPAHFLRNKIWSHRRCQRFTRLAHVPKSCANNDTEVRVSCVRGAARYRAGHAVCV
jgi:hypothetical protein